MKCNVALWDRLLRFVLGVILLTYAIAGGPIWAWSGLYFLGTAGWGVCPIYSNIGIRTLPERRRRSI